MAKNLGDFLKDGVIIHSCEVEMDSVKCELYLTNFDFVITRGNNAQAVPISQILAASLVREGMGLYLSVVFKAFTKRFLFNYAPWTYAKREREVRSWIDKINEFVATQKTQPSYEEDGKMSFDEQIATVKKLKELVDIGAITQEEFERKKKEIMGL